MTTDNSRLFVRKTKRTVSPIVRKAKKDAKLYGIPRAIYEAYCDHYNSAKRRGIDFLPTLPEGWEWWQTDNRWERRGVGTGRLVMGNYSPLA